MKIIKTTILIALVRPVMIKMISIGLVDCDRNNNRDQMMVLEICLISVCVCVMQAECALHTSWVFE